MTPPQRQSESKHAAGAVWLAEGEVEADRVANHALRGCGCGDDVDSLRENCIEGQQD